MTGVQFELLVAEPATSSPVVLCELDKMISWSAGEAIVESLDMTVQGSHDQFPQQGGRSSWRKSLYTLGRWLYKAELIR